MYKETDLNESKLNAMKAKILRAEQENLKTRERTNDAMVELIRQIIRNELKKSF